MLFSIPNCPFFVMFRFGVAVTETKKKFFEKMRFAWLLHSTDTSDVIQL